MLAAAVKRWARAYLIPDQPTGGAPLGGADEVTDGLHAAQGGAGLRFGLELAQDDRAHAPGDAQETRSRPVEVHVTDQQPRPGDDQSGRDRKRG